MTTYAFHHSVVFDTWSLSYHPEDFPGGTFGQEVSDGELAPAGEWTAFVSPLTVSPNAGIGLGMFLEDGDSLDFLAHISPPTATGAAVYVPFSEQEQGYTMRVEHFADGTLVYSHSLDLQAWTERARFIPDAPIVEVGVILRYDRDTVPATGLVSQFRLLQGIWGHHSTEVDIPDAPAARIITRTGSEAAVTSTTEPYVHGIIGAQFGDLEFDIGKSVRWLGWFVDNLFVLDINLGTQRYWIVNWAQTFPDAKHAITGINYFNTPASFRQEQWERYKKAFGTPADDEWVIFLDGHEGMGVDNRSLPDDYDFAPFKSFLWREIQRAQDLGESSACLPYYVFLRSDHITNVSYKTRWDDVPPDDPSYDQLPDPVSQAISVPYYEAYRGMRRIWNCGALKAPGFDWGALDRLEDPSPEAKLQILSYGYAHWNLQDIEPPATTVPALTADNDDGWRMRKLLSKVRPVPGLPVGDTWIPPDQDIPGLPGPWAPADANNPDPIDPVTRQPITQPVPSDPSLEALVTPLYDCVFRLNMRDGVWYETLESGNIPLVWDEASQTWTTDYNPEQWSDIGVKAYDPTAVPDPEPIP